MHASICAGCGGPVGSNHVDAEEVTGVRKTEGVKVEVRHHNLGLLREERTTTTHAWSKLVRHRFTICEACVRGRVRRIAEGQIAQMKAPPTKTGSLVASLLVVPGILAAATVLMWTRDPGWVRWVTGGAIPLWCALVLVGDKGMDKDSAEHVRAKTAATRDLDDLARLRWDEALERGGDLTYLRESIARARRRLEDVEVMNALDQRAVDLSDCPTDVIEVGVPHDPMAMAAKLLAAGVRPPS